MMYVAKDIIVIGGSAGSYSLIVDILSVLPTQFAAAICIVIHRNPYFETRLEQLLSTKLKRRVVSVIDKMSIMGDSVYFAPPGYHVLVGPDNYFALDVSDPVNYSRPSIDVLFDTASEVFGASCTAFLLSGANKDGAKGVGKILEKGGHAFIQDPEEAIIPTMPMSALDDNLNAKKLSSNQILNYFRNITSTL